MDPKHSNIHKKNKNQRENENIFLLISFNIYFGSSKELSHWDGSFEYPQHMFWLRNKKIKFCYTLLTKVLNTHEKGTALYFY